MAEVKDRLLDVLNKRCLILTGWLLTALCILSPLCSLNAFACSEVYVNSDEVERLSPAEFENRIAELRARAQANCARAQADLDRKSTVNRRYAELVRGYSIQGAHEHVNALHGRIGAELRKANDVVASMERVNNELNDENNRQMRLIEIEIEKLEAESEYLKANWDSLHRLPSNSIAKQLIDIASNPELPAESKSQITSAISRLPTYLTGNAPAPTQPVHNFEAAVAGVKRIFELKKNDYTAKFREELARVVAQSVVPLFTESRARQFYLSIQQVANVRAALWAQAAVYVGACYVAIDRLQSELNYLVVAERNLPSAYRSFIENALKDDISRLTAALQRVERCKSRSSDLIKRTIVQQFERFTPRVQSCTSRSEELATQWSSLQLRWSYLRPSFDLEQNNADVALARQLTAENLWLDLSNFEERCKEAGGIL